MRSRNHGILGSALAGELNLELTYRALSYGMREISRYGAVDPAEVGIDPMAEDVAFLMSKN